MARKKNKKRTPVVNHNNEYDLKKSLGKLNQRKEFPESETSTKFEVNKSHNSSINSQALNDNLTSETSIFFKLNDNINSRYDSLNNDIKSVNDKIVDTNQNLRQELENKVSDKLDKTIFYYAISVLVGIIGTIATLSYYPMIQDTKENSTTVKKNKLDIENQGEKINKNETTIDQIEDNQRELEFEIKLIKEKSKKI